MGFTLRAVKCATKEELDTLMGGLNESAGVYYDETYARVLSDCTNEVVKGIVLDWRRGKCVSTKEYEETYSKEDLYDAHSYISELISNGLG